MEGRRLKKAVILNIKPLVCTIPQEFLTPKCFHSDLRLEDNKLECPHCGTKIEAVRTEKKKGDDRNESVD